ncbi:hypothetical protein PQE71_gp187 [Bacillus phage Izhevsk]|uniref:Uncharacterized protein n=1 Tax=Bacillus phage Izhevsk TaxID=2724322 RepID=A0A6H0X6D3_9CAUD|nr:hypothetical protein PQE71_gp187 [Bacillus phage Izhevsk]QIW89869.1 hypothetical protein Izhevsk_188 [Bacillus phage Izhevsk]
MNMWERLKGQIKDVFKKTEPVVEKEKEEVVVKIPVRVAGVYNFFTKSQEYETVHHHHSYKQTGWFVHMNVKAVVQVVIDGVKKKLVIEDSIELAGAYWTEEKMYRYFMGRTEEKRNKTIEEGMKRLVIKRLKEEKLKDAKEQFLNLGKVEFDIKIEVNEESIKD